MFATQVPARRSITEQIRDVLGACQYVANARDYASQLIRAVAAATDSPCAIWLDTAMHGQTVVAQTDNAPTGRLLLLCAGGPCLHNALSDAGGILSIAATPVMFRSSIAGMIAVANSSRPYTSADLQLLSQAGRTALLEYETRVQAAETESETMAKRVADMMHDLRQPLSILEACTCLLEMALAPVEARAREHLDEMHRQLDRASGLMEGAVRGYRVRVDASRDLANAAISLVT
jgi:signal transduction histidine kinase